jgi:hypothetical protein
LRGSDKEMKKPEMKKISFIGQAKSTDEKKGVGNFMKLSL